jgi:hypothetical protein
MDSYGVPTTHFYVSSASQDCFIGLQIALISAKIQCFQTQESAWIVTLIKTTCSFHSEFYSHGNFRLFRTVQALSVMGNWMAAVGWPLHRLSGSAFVVAIVVFLG